ncbi:MAG TPA: hypothetical protein VF530_08925 [Planctomycetota bacterium]
MPTTTRSCTRAEAVTDLRRVLEGLQDDEHSMCEVAARKGLFCHGFAQWSSTELRRRYPQITRSRPHLTRQVLEDLANRWQLARQQATGERTACDVQAQGERYPQCRGWDEFENHELEAFHAELCGEPIRIVAEG